MQNEYHYKLKLKTAISKFLESITQDDNELGYIPSEMENNMTEAAWLILKQNYNLNKVLESENIVTN